MPFSFCSLVDRSKMSGRAPNSIRVRNPTAPPKRRDFRRQKPRCACGFFLSFFLFSFPFLAVFGTELRWFAILTGILLASLASVWLFFFPSCMLTWESSFALAAIIVTQLTTPYIRIAPAAGDGQLTGQTFKYRRVILPISRSFCPALSAPLHFLPCFRPV